MQFQDSSHPEGVGDDRPPANGGRSNITAARNRKADASVALKLAGASWAEIAQVVGYPTPRQALVATERALQRSLQDGSSREEMRKLAGARLDRLLRSVWAKALDDQHPEHLFALDKARQIIAQHAKLYGLDAPTEIVVHSPTVTELEAWVSSVLSGGAPPVEEYDIITGEVVTEATG